MKKTNMSLLILSVLISVGCSTLQTAKEIETDYLDFMCGMWSEKAVLISPDDQQFGEVTSTWVFRYDPAQTCYTATGKLIMPDGSTLGFSTQYQRISSTEAKVLSKDDLGNVNNGYVIQTSNNHAEATADDENGNRIMYSRSEFAAHQLTSTNIYYDASGQITMKAISTAHRIEDL